MDKKNNSIWARVCWPIKCDFACAEQRGRWN